jgi:hypothetical protein
MADIKYRRGDRVVSVDPAFTGASAGTVGTVTQIEHTGRSPTKRGNRRLTVRWDDADVPETCWADYVRPFISKLKD